MRISENARLLNSIQEQIEKLDKEAKEIADQLLLKIAAKDGLILMRNRIVQDLSKSTKVDKGVNITALYNLIQGESKC